MIRMGKEHTLCQRFGLLLKAFFRIVDAENILGVPKQSSLYQIVDQQPLRQMTETVPGLWFAVEDSTETISVINDSQCFQLIHHFNNSLLVFSE